MDIKFLALLLEALQTLNTVENHAHIYVFHLAGAGQMLAKSNGHSALSTAC